MASELRLFHALGLEPPNHRFLKHMNSTADMWEHPRATVGPEGDRCPTAAAALASPDQNHGAAVTTIASITVSSMNRATDKSQERTS